MFQEFWKSTYNKGHKDSSKYLNLYSVSRILQIFQDNFVSFVLNLRQKLQLESRWRIKYISINHKRHTLKLYELPQSPSNISPKIPFTDFFGNNDFYININNCTSYLSDLSLQELLEKSLEKLYQEFPAIFLRKRLTKEPWSILLKIYEDSQ